MIDIVLDETPKINNQYELIAILYFLPDFKDERLIKILDNLRSDKEYLIAYNATRVLGLSTDEVVQKFRNIEKGKKVTAPNSTLPKAGRSWWQKLFGSE
jgi:peptidoglycan hydrolase-like protein with peptidoglycan-binding domain